MNTSDGFRALTVFGSVEIYYLNEFTFTASPTKGVVLSWLIKVVEILTTCLYKGATDDAILSILLDVGPNIYEGEGSLIVLEILSGKCRVYFENVLHICGSLAHK